MTGETASSIPITVLTGFLGSGKTTLLNRLLADPRAADTAVLINEFGEVGIDHLLVREVRENVVVLNTGCLCCTIRGDLVDSLRDLFLQRVRGSLPEFQRLIIETTGLADPAPVIHTLMTDPLVASRYRLDGIVTTVDALHGDGQLDDHPESLKQAAVADRLVLTKVDLVDSGNLAALRSRLRALNPSAPILEADHGRVDPASLFDAGLFNAETKHADVRRWLNAEAYAAADNHGHHHHHHHDVNRHDASIRAFCLTIEQPIDWPAFLSWVDMLLATQGENFLRIKGVLNVAGEERPIAIHGVQHMFHPPAALPDWPDEERLSRIVFITRNIGREVLEKTWAAFAAAAAVAPTIRS